PPPRRSSDLVALGEVHAAAIHDLAPMREVDLRNLQVLLLDVLPHVQLRPVAEREDAEVLTHSLPTVVEAPELGPLIFRVPLAETVAVREEALLGARLLLVAPGSAD